MAGVELAGLVTRASQLHPAVTGHGADRLIPVLPQLRRLMPDGGLRRGSIAAVTAGRAPGATSLLLALLAQASATGAWIAVAGMPQLGLAAASELDIALERLVLVPHPGTHRDRVLPALVDGFDIVVLSCPDPPPAPERRQIAARVRANGALLVPFRHHTAAGPLWEAADLTLSTVCSTWHGLGQGWGRLRHHELTVQARGKGSADRPRETTIWLPHHPGPQAATGEHDRPDAPRLRLVR